MNKAFAFLITFGCFLGPLTAQSRLETAIATYNQVHNAVNHADKQTATAAEFSELTNTATSQIVQLDSFLTNSSDSMATAASYFRGLYLYELATYATQLQKTTTADSLYSASERQLGGFDTARFPIEYNLKGESYQVLFGDFGPILADLNAKIAQSNFNAKKYDDALTYARKADFSGYLAGPDKVINNYRLVRMLPMQEPDMAARFEAALNGIELFDELSQFEQKSVISEIPDFIQYCTDAISEIIKSDASYAETGSTWATLSRFFLEQGKEDQALQMADSAVVYGCTEREFLLSTIPLAKKKERLDLAKKSAKLFAEGIDDKECTTLQQAVDMFKELDDDRQVEIYEKKAKKCQSSITNSQRRDFGLYAGAYVLPLFRTDWGVHGVFLTRRHLFEVSYQAITDRRDRKYDLRLRGIDGAADFPARWDGYYAHASINKVSGKYGRRNYTGVLFGYNERNFQTIEELQITDNSGNPVTDGTAVLFQPVEKRYIVMLNSGSHSYGKILGTNWFFSIGGAWCQFDHGNTTYDRDTYNFSNPLINGRKDGRLVLMARFGMTVGLHVGPKTIGR
jgi:hypothetical protein